VAVNPSLAPGTTVPIAWIAAGDPAQLFSPDRHDELWAVQEPLDFPGTVYGLTRDATAHHRMSRQSAWLGAHQDDHVVFRRARTRVRAQPGLACREPLDRSRPGRRRANA